MTSHTALTTLEDETIHILREVATCFERPVLLFSGGKDSAVLLRMAEKAFYPAAIPADVLHVDTGHNFPEVLEFRDKRASELGVNLLVASVQHSIDTGRVREAPEGSRNTAQSITLMDAIQEYGFDAVCGGARRDEEKARAKERIFSVRGAFGRWDPRSQRPEVWSVYNTHLATGEHMRVYPLSNWTERDIWLFIAREQLTLPPLYYAHARDVVERDGRLLAVTPWTPSRSGERSYREMVRYRTVGDATCTAAVRSTATTPEQVLRELAYTRVSERGATRVDDTLSDSSMEDRKKEGYF